MDNRRDQRNNDRNTFYMAVIAIAGAIFWLQLRWEIVAFCLLGFLVIRSLLPFIDKSENIKTTKHSCGKSVSSDQTFCPGCGGKLDSSFFSEDVDSQMEIPAEEIDRFVLSDANEDLTHRVQAELEKPQSRKSFLKYLDKKVNGWKNEKIRFGVVGRSALGKSTFINTLLCYEENNCSAAKVGRGDTTLTVVEYTHSKHPDIKIVDTPGFGTIKFKKERFLQEVDLKAFDYFLIFIDTVLFEDDLWIAKEARKAGVPFCFLRNKIDVDIKEGNSRGESKQVTLANLRKKLEDAKKGEMLLENANIFLISNMKSMWIIGDWSALVNDIVSQLSDAKAYVLMSFIPVLTPDVIENKYKELKRRIPWICIQAVFIATIPLPGWEVPLNTLMILEEIEIYRKTFGLAEEYSKYFDIEIEERLKDKIMEKVLDIGKKITYVPLIRQYQFATHTKAAVESLLKEELLKRKETAIDLYRAVHQ